MEIVKKLSVEPFYGKNHRAVINFNIYCKIQNR